MRKRRPSVVRGLVSGAIAGIAATLIMDQFFRLTSTGQKAVQNQMKLADGESVRQIAHEHIRQEQQAAQQEDSTEKVARKIAEATGKTLAPGQKKAAGQAVHYTFGTLMGIVYGVSSEILPEVTTGAGTGYGTLLFLSAHQIAVPAFRLAPAPVDARPFDHLRHWAGHVVYGVSLELGRRVVRYVARYTDRRIGRIVE